MQGLSKEVLDKLIRQLEGIFFHSRGLYFENFYAYKLCL